MKTKCKIGDLGQVVTGKTPSTSKREYYGHEYPFITPSDITGSFHVTPATYLSSEGARLLNKIMIPAKSVCYTCIASIGKICVTKEDSFTNQQINSIIVDEEKNDFRYVYYLLKFYTNHIKAIATGAATPIVNKERFSNVEVSVHKLDKQKRIADILSSYDDLIENNQKQIKLLEEAAMRLYKEWFVNLRFPGHENTKIVDGVPEGWEKLYIEDVCQTVGGGTPSTKVPSYYNNGTIPWVTPTDITRNDCLILLDTEKKITEEGLARSSAKMLPSETILMTSRASVGFFGISEQEVCTNQGFISCIPNNKNLMMFLLLNLMSRKDEIRQKAGGATYLEINKSTFRKLIVIKPDDTLLNEFQSITYTILKRISALKKQSDLLKQARDKLLPKLMNGEIEV